MAPDETLMTLLVILESCHLHSKSANYQPTSFEELGIVLAPSRNPRMLRATSYWEQENWTFVH